MFHIANIGMRMPTTRSRLCAVLVLSVLVAATAQAKPWRIGVGGGRITGYIGTLALNGIHRECLTDQQLRDPAALAAYDLVIVSAGAEAPAEMSAAVEKYVAGGGVAITEERVMPSPSALPGQRLGPAPGPNLTFVGYNHPISQPMQSAGIIAVQASAATAILPEQGAAVQVLAEFTDEGVSDKYAGKLTGGRKHVPAMLLFNYGRGKWLFSGANVAMHLALRGPELRPWLLAALAYLTDGEVVPRLTTLPAERRLLSETSWDPVLTSPVPRRPPQDAPAADLPAGFEPLDIPPDQNTDFLLTGELMSREQAEILLAWHSPQWLRSIRFDRDKVRLLEVNAGRERVVREVARPAFSESLVPFTVRRQPELVTVTVAGEPLLMAATDCLQGQVAVNGVIDPYAQACAPVYFDDDFMRAEGESSPWETVAGKWELHKVEGEATRGANPFAFQATAETLAAAVTGYAFWDDYDFACSVRASADAVGLYANYQAPDNCLVLRLTYPRDEQPAELSLSRLTPDGSQVLARAQVAAEREGWHRLHLRVSGGRLIAGLDGKDDIFFAGDLVRGCGQVGLFAELGSALFDDVTVKPWRALPLPIAGDGPWDWTIEGGSASATRDALVLSGRNVVRALAPTEDLADAVVATQMQLAKADGAGVLLRYRGPRHHYRIAVAKQKRALELQVVRVEEGGETILARAPLPADSKGWLTLQARARGREISALVNGLPVVSVGDHAFSFGRTGLYCAGGSASFRATEAYPLEPGMVLTDPPTPPFAGIIDEHTWAGRGSGWVPLPADPDLFWHRGFFPGHVEVRLGVHRRADGRADASILLGEGLTPERAYVLSASQENAAHPVRLTLTRAGQQVATGTLSSSAAEGYAIALEREGDLLVARSGNEVLLAFRDPNPLDYATRVGFRRDAADLDPADVDVLSRQVRTHVFKTAPAQWQQLSGTWEISNRWSCSPQWTWLAGWNQNGPARMITRESYQGDVQVDFYIAAKMMPRTDGQRGFYEELRDLHAGLCEDAQGHGYHVVIGADNGTRTYLERNDQVVATNTSWVVPRSELHNNWLMVTLLKRGPVVSVRVWDSEVLRYEDPDPLSGGRIALGTQNNGVIIPRVTIYGCPQPL